MAISSKNGSKRAPISPSSSKSKVKVRAWEMKEKLAKKRLMDLTTLQKNMVELRDSVSMDKPIICYQPKEEETSSAMERAEEVQANLSPQFPSFLKLMLKSHVTGGFWLGLPKRFCETNLPKQDETVVLIDEIEQEYYTRYLVDKTGLSGGWRGFSIAHKLLEGDALVFQLIKPCKFKLYIVRATNLTEVDGATCLPNPDSHVEPVNTVKMEVEQEENADVIETMSDEDLEPIAEECHQKKDTERPISMSDDDNSDNLDTETSNGIRLSESLLRFEDVKSFQDFSIQVNGLILDSEIPKHVKTKYYDLCRSQNKFLHDKLVKDLNSQLVAGVISETINIADGIRAINPSRCLDYLQTWDKTLNGFEHLGMVVGFLRARIHKLLSLCSIEFKVRERAKVIEEVEALIAKFEDAKTRIENIQAEIRALKVKNNVIGSTFKEMACAPW